MNLGELFPEQWKATSGFEGACRGLAAALWGATLDVEWAGGMVVVWRVWGGARSSLNHPLPSDLAWRVAYAELSRVASTRLLSLTTTPAREGVDHEQVAKILRALAWLEEEPG